MLRELRRANVNRQVEWENAQDKTSLSYLGNAIAGEVGEACNIIKKLEREALGLRGSRATSQDLADELADVIIYIDLLAARFDIDLEEAIRSKFNKTSIKYNLDTIIGPEHRFTGKPMQPSIDYPHKPGTGCPRCGHRHPPDGMCV